jgi:hypothetical protein
MRFPGWEKYRMKTERFSGQQCRRRLGGMVAVMLLALAPAMAIGGGIPDEIAGDNFDGFDLTPCDATLPSDSSTAVDYAAAIDLCATTTEASHSPGLISASLTLTDNTGSPDPASRRIRSAYGGISPRRGGKFALLSTGTAAGSADDGYQAPEPGYATANVASPPSDWLAANNGAIPNPPGCQPISLVADDPVMLTLRIRVPNNAQSFSFDANYLTADFPEYTCGGFIDQFVALLDSSFGASLNPADKNIASVASAGGLPFSVNLALPDNGSFTQCVNGSIGCAQVSASDSIATCSGTSQLVGTGMDEADPIYACSAGQTVGGGSGWYVIRGNVVRGDIIELRLAIWDTGDHSWDSDVVLDNFRWGYQPVQAGAVLALP